MAYIINFDDYSTMPSALKEYILDNRYDLIKKSERNTVDRYGLLSLYDDDIYAKHKKGMEAIVSDYKFLAGHYTKIINKQELCEGLRPLNIKRGFARLRDLLIGNGFTDEKEIEELKQYCFNLYDYISGPRIGHLSFYYPLSNGRSCKHYADAIGGEIVEFGKEKFPQIYDFLCDIGISVKVTATVPFSYVEEPFNTDLLDNLIRVVLQYELAGIKDVSWMDYGIRTMKGIDMENILDIEEIKN